jgi:hypothetical protein
MWARRRTSRSRGENVGDFFLDVQLINKPPRALALPQLVLRVRGDAFRRPAMHDGARAYASSPGTGRCWQLAHRLRRRLPCRVVRYVASAGRSASS